MNLTPLQVVRSYYDSLAPGRRALPMELLDPHLRLEIPEGFPGGGRMLTDTAALCAAPTRT